MKKLVLLLLLISTKVEAVTYYVRSTASAGHTCMQSQTDSNATAQQTINLGLACLSAGDTLLIHGGTYPEFINASTTAIASGTSWANFTRIAAYPNGCSNPGCETVNVPFPGGCQNGLYLAATYRPQYIEFDGLVFDGTNCTNATIKLEGGSTYDANHIRFRSCEVKNSQQQNISVYKAPGCETCGEWNEFINNTIHGGGDPNTNQYHEMYIATSNNLIKGNNIFSAAAAGIQIWNENKFEMLMATGPDNNTITQNVIHDSQSGTAAGWGILTGTDNNTSIYNNIIYNVTKTAASSAGIIIYLSAGAQVYNNTIYGNAFYGLNIDPMSSTTTAINNIMYLNGTNCLDTGSTCGLGPSTMSNNLIGVDPKFKNEATKDFSLLAASPARNTGSNAGPATNDYIGTPRPQESIYDIGAYEFQPAGGVSITVRARGLIR